MTDHRPRPVDVFHDECMARAEAERPATPARQVPATDRATEWRAAADHLETLDPVEAALAGQHAWRDAAAELRRKADEVQQPWLSDSARIGRTLIWTWSDIGKGSYGEGYRAAQAEARALLAGRRDSSEAQQPKEARS